LFAALFWEPVALLLPQPIFCYKSLFEKEEVY